MPILKLYVGDVVRTRKAHPCGNDQWEIIRLGADVRITCTKCGRSVLMERVKLERRIRQFIRRGAGAADEADDGQTALISEERGAAGADVPS